MHSFGPNEEYVRRTFRTLLEISSHFEKLGETFCHSHLLNAIRFLQRLVRREIDIPYVMRCRCELHKDLLCFYPAGFFLMLCREIRDEALKRGVDLNTVIVNKIVVRMTGYLLKPPLEVQVWCTILGPVPNSGPTSL